MPIYRNHLSSAEYFKLCKGLNLLSLDLRAELKDLKLLYDIVNNFSVIKLPSYVSWYSVTNRVLRSTHLDSFCLVSSIQPRITKKYTKSAIPVNETDSPDQTASSFSKFENSYFYRVIQSWNRLPVDIRRADNRNIFLKLVEKFMWVKFYESHCDGQE
jgi:hypothetical protein